MNRASFGNFEQTKFLSFIQIAAQFDFAIDAVQKPLLRFTIHAIFGMNSGMPKSDRNALQIQSVSLCVQPQGHRCAGTQTGKQQVVRRRARISSEWSRFIRMPTVLAGDNLLR